MFEQLTQMIKDHASGALQQGTIDPSLHEGIVGEIANSVIGSISSHLTGGNADAVGSLLNGSTPVESSTVTQGANENLVQSLIQKLGLSPDLASNLATTILPGILGKVVEKTNDPNDKSFDLSGIISNLTSGASGGGINFNNILGSIEGGLFKK